MTMQVRILSLPEISGIDGYHGLEHREGIRKLRLRWPMVTPVCWALQKVLGSWDWELGYMDSGRRLRLGRQTWGVGIILGLETRG